MPFLSTLNFLEVEEFFLPFSKVHRVPYNLSSRVHYFLSAIFILNERHATPRKHSKNKTFEMRMFDLTWWYSLALAHWVEKMASCSVELAKISSTIRVYHLHCKSTNFAEILKCFLESGNKHSSDAVKVLSTKEETVRHVPETLAKILAPEMAKETILSLEAEVTGSPRDSPEGKWVLSGRIEISCTYRVYGKIEQKSYLRKKIKGTK